MDELESVVQELRARAQVFDGALASLEQAAPAIRQDSAAFEHWRKLVADGRSIRTAIQTAARMLDGARRWVANTFQTDALQAIPFASDVVIHTAKGALSSITQWLDRANQFLPAAQSLQTKFAALPEEKRKELTALPAEANKTQVWPAVMLLGAFAAAIWAFSNAGVPAFMESEDDDEIS